MELLDKYPSLPKVIALLVLAYAVGLLVRRIVFARLAQLTEQPPTKAQGAIVSSLQRPLPLWFLLGGAALAPRLLALHPDVSAVLEKIIHSLVILSLTFWAANLGSKLLQIGAASSEGLSQNATGVIRYVVKFTILGIGGLVLLSTHGISIGPLLTTVGIGGIAVALGLQETLANLFAGVQLSLARNLRVGDFIRLESGEEGYIEDVQWRSTRLRTLYDNLVLIPNARLAQNVVTNYARPSKELTLLIELGVHYSSDLERVEEVLCEVARGVMRSVPGGVPEFEPRIRFRAFGESSIDLTVYLRAREFADHFVLRHEFIKATSKAFAREGIVIPYPIRAINLEQEKSSVAALVE